MSAFPPPDWAATLCPGAHNGLRLGLDSIGASEIVIPKMEMNWTWIYGYLSNFLICIKNRKWMMMMMMMMMMIWIQHNEIKYPKMDEQKLSTSVHQIRWISPQNDQHVGHVRSGKVAWNGRSSPGACPCREERPDPLRVAGTWDLRGLVMVDIPFWGLVSHHQNSHIWRWNLPNSWLM